MLAAVSGTADHVLRNRAAWDRWAEEYAGPGLRNWAAAEPSWGIWRIAEVQAGVLSADGLAGPPRCAAGRAGQLRGAAGHRPPAAGPFRAAVPLIHASAEQAPVTDASFDLAISEYGASIWCDPYAWIPEAARLLRPSGQLIFLVNSVLLMLTVPDTDGLPATEQLLRPYFGMHRFEWPDDESVEFHLGHGDMIRLLRGCGLEVEDLLELRPGPGATTRYPLTTLEWARQWPCEEVWKARKLR